MAYDDIDNESKPGRGRVAELLNKHNVEYPDRRNPKREKFLAMLKQQYGYTNEQSVAELERLLKQFYRTNDSLGIRRPRLSLKPPSAE